MAKIKQTGWVSDLKIAHPIRVLLCKQLGALSVKRGMGVSLNI